MKPQNSIFSILCLSNFILAMGNTGVLSIMPAIGRGFELSDSLVASVFAGSTLLWALCAPGWGRLSDRIGRRPVMIIGLVGFTLSLWAFGWAATLGLELILTPFAAFCLMAVARTVHGAVASASPVALQAFVADRSVSADRVKRMSYLASAQGLGFVVGPALAPLLIFSSLGLAGPIYAFGLAGLFALVLVVAKLHEIPPASRPQRAQPALRPTNLWFDSRVRAYFAYGLMLTSVQAMTMSVLGYHVLDLMTVNGLSIAEAQPFIGIAMFAGAVATLLAQWGLVWLRMTVPHLLMSGVALSIVGVAITACTTNYLGATIGYTVVSLGVGLARPGFTAGASMALGADRQGAAAGILMSISGIAFMLPPVIGVALHEWNVSLPSALNVGVLATAAILCWRNRRQLLTASDRTATNH